MAPNRYYDTTTPGTTLEFNLDTVSEPQIPASYNITLLPQQYPYTMLIDWNTASYEVINVTGAPTGAGPYSLPCIRGEDGTTATTHASGAVIVHGISARDYQEPQDHLGSDNAVHGVTGDVVGTTDTQTLTNKTLASPAFTGTPTGLTYTEVGADPAGAAATAQSTAETFATSAVSTETTRAETAEALKLAKAANLSDVASQSTALTNITGSQASGYYVRSNGSSAALATLQLTDAGSTVWPIAAGNTIVVAASGASAKIKAGADYVCTGTNDQNTINSAISSVASAGGTVRLSAGTFTISAPVTITASSISLEGTGVSTKLNVPEGTDISYAIEITGTGTVEVKIRKLYIQLFAGDSNGTGIYIDTPWSTTDTQHTFEDLYINGCPNNGIQVPASADTRVMLFNRVHVKAVGGNGFYMAYPSVTDSVFTNCIADTTGDSGFFIGGANNWFTNCKSFYCGSSGGNTHGFYIVGYNNYFTGCQAQDNYQSGFYGDNTGDATYGSYGCTFDNCSADSNGQNGGSTYCRGWQVNGAKNWQITGGLAFNRPYGSYWQKYGISVQGTSSDTVINDVLFFGNVTAGLIDTSAGPTYSTSNPTPSWINVQEYAADHTGAIDATASIQAALNAAAEGVTGAYGSVAYLPAGTYKVSAPLTIPQGVTFLGDSGGWAEPSGNYGLGGVPVTGTILMPSSAFTPTSGNGAAVIYLTTGNAQGGQQQIKQISIDGQNAPSSNSIHGIQAYNAVAGVKLRDVLVYGGTSSNLGGNGLDMRPGTNQNPDFWDVAHCKFSSMGGNGVNMNGVSDSYFVSVEATGNTGSNWNITNCGNCRYVGCKGENSGAGQGWFLTAVSGFTGELAFTGCTSQFNHLDGWYLTGPGAGMYQFTGIRSVSDGESSGSAFTLTGSFNGTAIFTGVASVPGTSYPADGLHISSLGTSAEVMIANSVIWGYSTATVTDNSGTLLLDPNVVYRTGAIGSPVSVTQALGISQGGTSATSASAARTALGAAPIVSPVFTGIPAAPTASPLTNNTQIATTAYADSAVSVETTNRTNAEDLIVAHIGNIFSPMDYGAGGALLTDDTTAVQDAITAAGAVGGTVYLGTYKFKTTSPMTLYSNVTFLGASAEGGDLALGEIRNETTDMFQINSGSITNLTMTNISLTCDAGHIFDFGTGPSGAGGWVVNNCAFVSNSSSHCIIYGTSMTWIGCYFGGHTIMDMAGNATLPAVYMVGPTSSINTNTWGPLVLQGAHSQTSTFFHIECTGDAWQAANIFRDIDCEECDAGVITLAGCSYSVIENVQCYDTTTFTGSLFQLLKGTGSGLYCNNITIRNSGTIGGGFSTGAYHVYCPETYGALILENVGGESGSPLLDVPLNTVIIGGVNNNVGLLPEANTWTGNQIFESGKPWFDVDAFGADPTGNTDSTLAFNKTIAASLGGRFYNNLGYTASSTTVTNPSALSTDLGLYINSTNFSTGYSHITAVTPGVGYTVAAAATSNLSAQSAFIGYNQTTSSAYALGPVHMSAGSYHISSDINIVSVLGFQLVGSGTTATTIFSTGTSFTNAVIFVNGSLDSTFEKFAIAGTGTAPNAFYLTWNPSTAGRSTSGNTLRSIRVRNMNFTAGIRIGAIGGAYQVDGSTLIDIVVNGGQTLGSWTTSGPWQYGFYIGNGISGNQYDHVLFNCSAGLCYYGYYNSSSGYQLFGAQPGGNYCDFYETGVVQQTRQAIQSQNAQIFVIGSGGSSTVLTAFRDVLWNGWPSSAPPNDYLINITGGAAGWEFSNCKLAIGTSPSYAPLVRLNGNGADVSAMFTNFTMQNSYTSGFSIVGTANVVLVDYIDLSNSYTVSSMTPLAVYKGGTWIDLTISPVAPNVVTLTDASTISVNSALGNDFRLTLTGNSHTIATPSSPSDGQRILFQITQGSGGPYLINWGAGYQFPSVVPPPSLSTSSGYTDLIGFVYNATIGQWLYVAVANGFT
jgi:hypothetical protein